MLKNKAIFLFLLSFSRHYSKYLAWIALAFFLLFVTIIEIQANEGVNLISEIDDTGAVIKLVKTPKRIVSLAPHITENIFSAGAGKQLVAVVDYSDFPEAANLLPRVGGYNHINVEAIIALKPDLVIAWEEGNPAAALAQLRSFGIPVFVSDPKSLEDIAFSVKRLGRLLGTEKQANQAAEKWLKGLSDLKKDYVKHRVIDVFYEIWPRPLITVSKHQAIHDAISLCRGRNIFENLRAPTPIISLEAVLEADPEVIVASSHLGEKRPAWLDDWKKWKTLKAVKHRHLYHLNADIMNRPTFRMLEGTRQLCHAFDQAR